MQLTFRGDEGLVTRPADGIDGGAAWVATKAGFALSGGMAETTTATSLLPSAEEATDTHDRLFSLGVQLTPESVEV